MLLPGPKGQGRALSNPGASLPSLSSERTVTDVGGVCVAPVNASETGRPQPSRAVHVRAAAVAHDPSSARSPCPSLRTQSPLATADWLPESPCAAFLNVRGRPQPVFLGFARRPGDSCALEQPHCFLPNFSLAELIIGSKNRQLGYKPIDDRSWSPLAEDVPYFL